MTTNGAEIVQEAFRRGVEAARAIVLDEVAQLVGLEPTDMVISGAQLREARKILARIDRIARRALELAEDDGA